MRFRSVTLSFVLGLVAVIGIVGSLGVSGRALAAPGVSSTIDPHYVDDALNWLTSQQQPDGGFTNGFSEGADLGTTMDVILAIVAAQQHASTWSSGAGNSPLDYVQAQITAGNVDLVGEKAKARPARIRCPSLGTT